MTDVYLDGTIEFLSVQVSANITLDVQLVELSIDKGATWLPCNWQGAASTARTARTDSPIEMVADEQNTVYPVWVRVTDSPEIPLMVAGSFSVVSPYSI